MGIRKHIILHYTTQIHIYKLHVQQVYMIKTLTQFP